MFFVCMCLHVMEGVCYVLHHFTTKPSTDLFWKVTYRNVRFAERSVCKHFTVCIVISL